MDAPKTSEVLRKLEPNLGHRWKVAAEGPLVRTRCIECLVLFSTWWEGRNRMKCEPTRRASDGV